MNTLCGRGERCSAAGCIQLVRLIVAVSSENDSAIASALCVYTLYTSECVRSLHLVITLDGA